MQHLQAFDIFPHSAAHGQQLIWNQHALTTPDTDLAPSYWRAKSFRRNAYKKTGER
jgi:hypothetical protein